MAFISGNDVRTLCISGNPISNGSLVVFNNRGGSASIAGSGAFQKIDPPVNNYPDSGVAYTRAHRRFFPQFLMVTSGNYDYTNG